MKMKNLTSDDLRQIASFNKIVMNYLKMIRLRDNTLRLLLYCLIALVPLGCGARKSSVKINDSKAVEGSKITEQVNTQESGTKSYSDTQTAQADKTKEGTKVTKETTYDPATGNKTSEKEMTETKKSVDRSTKLRVRTFEETYIRYVYLYRNIDTHRTRTTHVKDKDTDANNNALYWMIVGVLTFGIVVYGVYKYLTRKV